MKRLAREVEEYDERIGRLNESLKALAEEIASLEDEKDSAEQKINLIKVMRDSENNRLEQLDAKLSANKTLIEKLKADYEDILRARERSEEDRRELAARLEELDGSIEKINQARAEMDVSRNAALDKKAEAEARVTAIIIASSEIKKDIETALSLNEESRIRIESFVEGIKETDEKIDALKLRISDFETARKHNRNAFENASRLLAELNAKRSKIEEGSTEFERRLSEVNSRIREKHQQKENVFKEYTRFENRLANLTEERDKLASRLWDEHEMTRADAQALGYPELDATTRAEAAAKQTECKNKLRFLGNVDLDAVNKYKEVKERYDYMSVQLKDLNDSKANLEGIIHQLEGEMKTAFIDSFEQINENFNRVFGELFGGGSAELSLTDPDNVLESGIEIKAAPPGKIIKSLVQLSGGEQAFIAIALFFAILQVNPTPFCILDEIEAALDEVNVARFAEYIKRYSSETQFVLITHRRGTMEAANRLYGVTMPEHGISKVLELDINDISKKEGEDWDGIFG